MTLVTYIDDHTLARRVAEAVLNGEATIVEVTAAATPPPLVDKSRLELKACEWCDGYVLRPIGTKQKYCPHCTPGKVDSAAKRNILRHFSAGAGTSTGYRRTRARHKRGDTIDAGPRPPSTGRRKKRK